MTCKKCGTEYTRIFGDEIQEIDGQIIIGSTISYFECEKCGDIEQIPPEMLT